MRKVILATVGLVALVVSIFGCRSVNEDPCNIDANLNFAEKQLTLLLEEAYKNGKIPRTATEEGSIHWTRQNFDWTQGFFPGTCWYLFEHTKDEKWKDAAEFFQGKFKDHRTLPYYHDLGFVFNCY